jgi:hypothetical protein
MEKETPKQLTERIFTEIKNARNIAELKSINTDKYFAQKNRMSEDKYPPIKFEINYDEIKEFLGTENNLLKDSSQITNPLAKLLYALAWKNGDLVKIKHIVEGIKDVEMDSLEKRDGLVFYQFGKYLAKKNNEPIIDQHVIRAFLMFKSDNYKISIDKIIEIEVLNSENHKDYIKDYKLWLSSNELKASLKNEQGYMYYIDQVLFALGKTIKLKPKTKKIK